ncbi:MAG: hypothetical protein FWD92_05870 [Methanomassiliicoccaceae archaeon]|nr:hypothetical protein [Methanomassiliicoccaceae archaeon]
MVIIPEKVLEAFNDPKSVKVLTSVETGGQPHVIVCGSISALDAETVVVGEILMKKTSSNLERHRKAAVLVLIDRISYVIHVKVKKRIAEGPVLDNMNHVLAGMGLRAHAVWAFEPLAVYDQSASQSAGIKLA